MTIDQPIIDVLAKCRVENNLCYLPGQLDRNIYLKTNKVLESIGLSWSKKQKCHISNNGDIEDKFSEIINTGEYSDKKKELQFFETPTNIAADMVEMAEISENHTVLEPSCGKGRIVKEIYNKTKHIDTCEIDTENFVLTHNLFGCSGCNGNGNSDFLSLESKERYDRIVMNPPFAKQKDVEHILHAWKFLRPGGILVSVVSESPFFRENKKSVEFRKWLKLNNGESIKLDQGTFKESGTMVKTRIIKVKK